jgi:hypothetical protein
MSKMKVRISGHIKAAGHQNYQNQSALMPFL